MTEEIKIMAQDFNNKKKANVDQVAGIEKPPQCQNTSPVISAIIWARQFKLKIESNMQAARSLFSDVKTMDELQNQSKVLFKDISQYEKRLYEDWKKTTLGAIQNKREEFEMTGRLMEFDIDAGDLLKVNYSEKLVTLVKDGRAIGELGFKVEKEIAVIIERAKKFYKEGVCLKQIANFYNSMSSQIVDCQKPMMLEKAS